MYFPPSSPATRNLCPNATISPGTPTLCPLGPTTRPWSASNPYDFQPCYYAPLNNTSTANSGPYVVEGGNTFYENRAYISIATAFARDACGFVGGHHGGTIFELKSSDIYSIGGYHHEFEDVGYQVNFNDFTSVPSYAYYMGCDSGGLYCEYEGSRYSISTDFLNGQSDINLGRYEDTTSNEWIWDEAYAPTLLLPRQIRSLDPAWFTCSLALYGIYDPPRALQQATSYAGVTTPSAYDSPTNTPPKPASSPTDGSAPATAKPQTTPAPAEPEQGPSQTNGGATDQPPYEGATQTSQDPTSADTGADGANPHPSTSTRNVGGISTLR